MIMPSAIRINIVSYEAPTFNKTGFNVEFVHVDVCTRLDTNDPMPDIHPNASRVRRGP
jgi:hypothetical protein